jgi:L-fucose mutarotase
MLQYKLLHPEILAALASAGHGSQVLIADGNYPFTTGTHPDSRRVFLNLMPGIVKVTDVLEALLSAIPVESAYVMLTADGSEPSIFQDFRQLLPHGMALNGLSRFDFYAAARTPNLALAIATADQRLYANLLLTIGVRQPE